MLSRRALALPLVVAAMLATGCASSDPKQTATRPTAASPTSPTPSPCPAPTGGITSWPAGVPSGLPVPPGAKLSDDKTVTSGVRVIRFSTPTSLRESVIFVVREVPKAGFVLGRGDAEAAEADAPFVRGNVRGAFRMAVGSVDNPCLTEWLLAFASVTKGGTPLLPFRSPSGSPSPLPFG